MLRKYLQVLGIILISSITFFLIMPTEAFADGGISINPNRGKAGSKVDVTVKLEHMFMDVNVFFDTNGNGKWDKGEPGNSHTQWFTKTRLTSLKVPKNIRPGTYKIIAQTEDSRSVLVYHYTYSATYILTE
jgi:hypothetical protein